MNYIGDRDADKAFLFIFSTPTCKALACSFYLVSFSLGCAGTSYSHYYFISVVLYCSVFGEDALVNVSVEKKEDNDGKLAGYIRIRSKTQGIALSLGDRITSVQRGLLPKQ